MKKLLRIKFENIIAIAGFILFTDAMIEHQIVNGFSLNNMFYESLFYYPVVMMCRYGLKEVRFNLQQML